MGDENMELEDLLSRCPLPTPTAGLRRKVLTAARTERRVTRRRAVRHLGATAAVLLMVIVGVWLERAEIAVGRALLANRTTSRAEREAEELTVALADTLDGNGFSESIQRRFRIALSASPGGRGIVTWHRKTEQELNGSGEE